MAEGNSLTIGGYNISGMMVAVALPVLSALGGGAWYVFDALSRFNDLEASVEAAIGLESRVQAAEQTIATNGVAELGPKLSSIAVQMDTILSQQAQLLTLRESVQLSKQVTDGLGDKMDVYDMEIEDLWKAFDELVANPLGR